jgi:DNA invertase Pin-like site-specific DNA recombinase
MQDHSTNLDPLDPLAFSYIRFSHPSQSRGDSLRRQTEDAASWCQKNQVQLDASLTLHDLGKSAYLGKHRANPDRHALAAFLKFVEDGRIPKGSYLIVENLDRLTREDLRPAIGLFLSILDQGVNIVTTRPERVFRHESTDMTDVIMAVIELARGHSESQMKSERVGKAWGNKKRKAREEHVIMTTRLPAWIEVRGGKLVLIPERAAAIRLIYQLATDGRGTPTILQKLIRDKVPSFGRTGKWTRSYVTLLLRDRRVLGEHVPRTRGKRDKEPILGYYPAVIESEAEWLAARGAVEERRIARSNGRQKRPRPAPRRLQEGKPPAARERLHVNIFAGILRHARDGDRYIMTQRHSRSPGKPARKFQVLITRTGDDGAGPAHSITYQVFEDAILSLLREVDPHEILNGHNGPDETLILGGEYARVEAELVEAAGWMEEHGFSSTIARRIAALEARKKDLGERLAHARMKAAHPLSETWGEGQGLMAALRDAADPVDVRLRLRAVFRRIVSEIVVLSVTHRQDRLIAVQVFFHGSGRRRDYVILHRQANWARPEKWWAKSLAEVNTREGLDLRKPSYALQLERLLVADAERIIARMTGA